MSGVEAALGWAGGLMAYGVAYGVDFPDILRRSAVFVDKSSKAQACWPAYQIGRASCRERV